MKVIGVVGLPASGKGEFSKIAAARGIPVAVSYTHLKLPTILLV